MIALAAAALEDAGASVGGLILSYLGQLRAGRGRGVRAGPSKQGFRGFFERVVARWGTEATLTLSDFAPSLRSIPAMASLGSRATNAPPRVPR